MAGLDFLKDALNGNTKDLEAMAGSLLGGDVKETVLKLAEQAGSLDELKAMVKKALEGDVLQNVLKLIGGSKDVQEAVKKIREFLK